MTFVTGDGTCHMHVPRCGGTGYYESRRSEIAYMYWLGPNGLLKRDGYHWPGKGYTRHVPFRLLPEHRSVVAVIRNPFERTASYWRRRTDMGETEADFESFIEHELQQQGDPFHWFLSDASGNVRADVLRLEDLRHTFAPANQSTRTPAEWTERGIEIVREKFRWSLQNYYPEAEEQLRYGVRHNSSPVGADPLLSQRSLADR